MPPLLAGNGLVTQMLGDTNPVGTGYGVLKDFILAALVVWLFASGRWRTLPPPLVWLVGAFLAVGVLGMTWANTLFVAVYGFRNDFYPALWVLVATAVFASDRARSGFAVVSAVAGVIAATTVVATWSRGVDWLLLLGILPPVEGEPFPSSYFNSGVVTPRGFSPWESPNIAGVVLVMMVGVIALALPVRPWIRLLVALSLLPAVWLTGSRSSLLGLGAVFGLLTVRKVWLRWGVKAVVSATVGVAALGAAGVWAYFFRSGRMADDPSLAGHSDSLVEGLSVVADHPWGVGVGEVGPRSIGTSEQTFLLESSWLHLAVEASVLATIAFVLIQMYPLVRCLTLPGDPHAYVAPAAIAASLVSQLVLPTVQEGPFSHYFYLCLGFGLAAAAQHLEPSEERALPTAKVT